jgi:hypothetical protein
MLDKTTARLTKLGLVLPQPVSPLGSYQTVSLVGNEVHVSGLGPFQDGVVVTGIVGTE